VSARILPSRGAYLIESDRLGNPFVVKVRAWPGRASEVLLTRSGQRAEVPAGSWPVASCRPGRCEVDENTLGPVCHGTGLCRRTGDGWQGRPDAPIRVVWRTASRRLFFNPLVADASVCIVFLPDQGPVTKLWDTVSIPEVWDRFFNSKAVGQVINPSFDPLESRFHNGLGMSSEIGTIAVQDRRVGECLHE